jgi:hypothetical protein
VESLFECKVLDKRPQDLNLAAVAQSCTFISDDQKILGSINHMLKVLYSPLDYDAHLQLPHN